MPEILQALLRFQHSSIAKSRFIEDGNVQLAGLSSFDPASSPATTITRLAAHGTGDLAARRFDPLFRLFALKVGSVPVSTKVLPGERPCFFACLWRR